MNYVFVSMEFSSLKLPYRNTIRYICLRVYDADIDTCVSKCECESKENFIAQTV